MKTHVLKRKKEKKSRFCLLNRMCMIVVALMMVCSSVAAAVDEKPDLKLNLSVEKQVLVKDENGLTKIKWQPVKTTKPGDLLRYTIQYTNKGKGIAKDAVIVDPVPKHTVFVESSAEGENSAITYSIDGKVFKTPDMLTYTIKQADGKEIEQIAPPEMYTHINWKLLKPVLPGASGTLTFNVKIK
jgi:uncharacterized repeat protein (TIGR01451 family)